MNFLAEAKRARGKALRLVKKNPIGVGAETLIVVGGVAAVGALIYLAAKKSTTAITPATPAAAPVLPAGVDAAAAPVSTPAPVSAPAPVLPTTPAPTAPGAPAVIVIPPSQGSAGTWVASTEIPPGAQFAMGIINPPPQIVLAFIRMTQSLGGKIYPIGAPPQSFWPIKADSGTRTLRAMGQNNTSSIIEAIPGTFLYVLQ